jgi:hypothetical protein
MIYLCYTKFEQQHKLITQKKGGNDMATQKQYDEVFRMADDLIKDYHWDKWCELTSKCVEYEIDYYDLENGFGIGDYCFYYEE